MGKAAYHEVEALARVLLPEIQAFFESEEGQREYAEWKARHQAEQENRPAIICQAEISFGI